MAATKGRRTPAETLKVVLEAKKLIDSGMMKEGPDGALQKVGLVKSVYDRYEKRGFQPSTGRRRPQGQTKPMRVERGRIDVRSIPPRPKGGKGGKRPFNPNSVAAVANRINMIDKRLMKIDALHNERKQLAQHLAKLVAGLVKGR